MSNKDLSHLTTLQYEVTQNNATEPPFENEYNDFFETGLYVDIVSGEVLFSSLHKFPSPCGWPAFYKAIGRDNIIQVEDRSHGMKRIEVRSKLADSHLGHVFSDGPAPTGIRYCINSAAIKFIPVSELEKYGLNDYQDHFLISKKNQRSVGQIEYATLGAGCFWGVEAILKGKEGVLKATSGYCGGDIANPTYQQICTGRTGHAEVVQVEYDSSVLSFEELLNYFFRLHDPTTLNAQGVDIGTQYRSVIFFHTDEQKEIAKKVIDTLNRSGKYQQPIVTELSQFETFYPAEDYHQDYYHKKYAGGFGPICHFVREE